MGTPKGTIPWNAGTGQGWTDKRGYRWIYVVDAGKRRARREHRVVMERHLGRALEPWEVVHHKDGNPSNNTLGNLEVVEFGAHSAGHHTGARHTYEARKRMEAFAVMREQLKHERALKADMLADLRVYAYQLCEHGEFAEVCGRLDDDACFGCRARRAIAKAEGREP